MTTPLPPSSVGIGSIYSPPSSSSSSSSTKLASLRTSPIAHFVSSPNDGYGYDEDEKKKQPQSSLTPIPTTGRLIAVNARYVVYAVRKGLVRVIDRRSASKALLRGHDEKSRLVDAAFFDGQSGQGGPGVFGLWDELCMAHCNNNKKGGSADNIKATTKVQPTTTAALDMLATLGGINDQASVLIWRLHSSGTGDSDLGADKLMEIRLGGITNKIVWHPHNPNQFIVLHRNSSVVDNNSNSFPVGTIATVVETAKLNVHLDENEGHTVCADPFTNGTKSLVVTDGRGGMGGANDIAWCGHVGVCYALTGHDDGCVRLWDTSSVGSKSQNVPCMVTLNVASDLSLDDAAKRVTRVLFLSRYVDRNTTSNRAITAPFIVGTAMNHTVTLWSSFSTSATGGNSIILQPTCLRVFGLRPFGTNVEKVSNLMSLEICPAPYRPSSMVPLSGGSGGFLGGLFGGDGGGESKVMEEDVLPPSSFVLLAERNVGVVHAVHIDSQWVDDGENTAVAVVGFDYVTTLNCVNPIYSLSPCSSVGEVGNGTLERDVDLCVLGSKAVQMLTLTAGMVTPPEGGWTDSSTGVTVLGSQVAVSCDELDVNDGDYEDYEEEEGDAGEDKFEDDYDVEGEGPDSGNDDDENDGDAAVPTASEPDSFSNWLCSIAVPPQKEARAVSVPPGLSSTYLLPDQVMSSVDPPTTKNRGAASKSLSSMPPTAAISSSKSNASKSSNKKNGQGGTKTLQPSSNQPIKILLKQEPKQELAFDPPSSVAVSVGSTTDIGAVLASQLKSHETQLLSSLQKTIVSEVASAVRSSFKDSQKATEQAIQRGISSGLSTGFDTSQSSKIGKSLEKAAKESAATAAKEAVASMQPLIMKALQQVSFSFKKVELIYSFVTHFCLTLSILFSCRR
jgi:hypothetical protein